MYQLMGLGAGNNKIVNSHKEFLIAASGNSGNLIFNYAIQEIAELAACKIKWSTPSEAINTKGNNLLLPMANNIGAHMDLSVSGPKLDNIDVKAAVIGLGVQFNLHDSFEKNAERVPEGSLKWLKHVADRSAIANISVRGELTRQYFCSLGLGDKVVSLGCPSHLINANPKLGEFLAAKSEKISRQSLQNGIGIAAGNPALKNLSNLEQFLILQLNQFGGSYIVQAPKPLICLSEAWLNECTMSEFEDVQNRWFPKLSFEQMLTWFRRYSKTYISVPQWFRDISKLEMVVGTRIHGCQIALQAGVPAVCLYIDSRTKELCETMNIPNMDAREFQKAPKLDELFSLLKDWDWTGYDRTRLQLAKETLTFFENNSIRPTKHLKTLAV